ncbi:hypothetical protein HP532_03300 [Pseudomonas sp. CrR25]|nr:hypothetical protein [Pseudomonas sp. CrR25]
MPNRWQVGALVAVALISFLAALFSDETPSTLLDVLRLFSASITATTLSLAVFHFGLWRYVPKVFAPKPDINGTWRVRIEPWTPDGDTLEPFDGYMFVRQNYFTLSMRLETENACSELEAEKFIITKGGLFELWAIYFCEPRAALHPNSLRPHYGAMKLVYSKKRDSVELKGRFWTDGVLTNKAGHNVIGGNMLLYDRKPETLHDYEVAVDAYSD